jgi:hypothetical protein
MMNPNPFNSHLIVKLVSLVLLAALTFNNAAALPLRANAPRAAQMQAASQALLQFSAEGHILGFTANGMYAADGSHAMHVDFLNANNIQPQADTANSVAGKTAPLDRVVYTNLWDGISLTYHASAGSIYTTVYTVSPGAGTKNIRLRYNAPLTLNKDGTLSIAFQTGAMIESAPIAWQDIRGSQRPIDVSYQVNEQEITFWLGAYDPGYALIIDPSLTWHSSSTPNTTWNTFLSESGWNEGNAIALDTSGNIYVTGYSTASWGESSWGKPVRTYAGSNDAFVVKLDSYGRPAWYSFLGGSGYDEGYGIALDPSGNIYVTGWSTATWGSPVQSYKGGVDAFAATLNSSGSLIWNTFLGGSGYDAGQGIAVDGSGNTYVTGWSTATWGCPRLSCTGRSYTNGYDVFTAKLDSSGRLTWNTFLGGLGYDVGQGIAVDLSGNVYVTGYSTASWGSSVRAYTAGDDAFAAKLNSSGGLTWNTFLGGSGDDIGQGITVDRSGNVFVTGYSTAGWSRPVRTYTGGYDAFTAKLSSSGGLTWNTFLGGSGDDYDFDIAVDSSGNVYVTGFSYASWGSPVRAYASYTNAFAAKLNSSGSLIWNTFLGGNGNDYGQGITVDRSGNVYVAGLSGVSWGNPTLAYGGGGNTFVVKLSSSGSLTWNNFLSGSGHVVSKGIALDKSGNVYVAGFGDVTWGNSVRSYTGNDDAFTSKLNSFGSQAWNTFLGGNDLDTGMGIAVDGSGNIYVTGDSNASWGSPVRAYTRSSDAYVAKLDPSGNLIWNTFLGGSGADAGDSIAVEGNGIVYVAGEGDASWGSPIRGYTTGYSNVFAAKLDASGNLIWNSFLRGVDSQGIALDGNGNAYLVGTSDASWGSPVRAYTASNDIAVAKLDSSGNLIWNTFLGGSGVDQGNSIAVDRSGNVYVTGSSTASWGGPVRAYASNADVIIAKLRSSGNLIWNTFLGGTEDDVGYGIAVDGSGNVYVTGYSQSSWGSPVRVYTGGPDAITAKLDPTGNLIWNTFLGGTRDDVGYGIAVDGSGNVYVAGYSYATWGNPLRAYIGYINAFAAKLDSSGNLK